MMIGRTFSVCLAAASFALLIGIAAPASAGPGVVATPQAGTALVQDAGYYRRRWRYRDDGYSGRETFVAAPFARVYSGRYGTWVRAPFVNLWVPR
jgi:hypothetical protein